MRVYTTNQNGQITIPKKLRDMYGSLFVFVARKNEIALQPAVVKKVTKNSSKKLGSVSDGGGNEKMESPERLWAQIVAYNKKRREHLKETDKSLKDLEKGIFSSNNKKERNLAGKIDQILYGA